MPKQGKPKPKQDKSKRSDKQANDKGKPTPGSHIPILYDVQQDKKAGVAQHVRANRCCLDWLRGHRARDHKELKGE